jgi:hypothetical protein
MAKKEKLKTPDWVLEGYDSKEEYEKAKGISKNKKQGKVFRIRRCPKCGSEDVGVVLGGEEGKGSNGWECHKCKWKGTDIKIEEVGEKEFMKYLDEKGEGVA